MHLPRHPFACACRRLAAAVSSPALPLAHGAPRRASRGCVGPAELRGGRAGEGQARRPPSPSPAPPPSRAPAVALCSPSSSVRVCGRGVATLPCSLGGERKRRSAARAAGVGGGPPPRVRGPRAGELPGELRIGGGPPPRRASNRRQNWRWARDAPRARDSPAPAARPYRPCTVPPRLPARRAAPQGGGERSGEDAPPSRPPARPRHRRLARPHPAATPPRARGGKQGRGARSWRRSRGGALRPPAATDARAGVASSATARVYGHRDGRWEEAGPLADGGEAGRRERKRRVEREWPGWQPRHKIAATS
ncbi:hypothetical protein PVAP13_4NG292138 [Panicum virgatum]|uniref:Uncharacterized protein n=1 Tax=Panicum virgatum TaxID=38727 RepID=A0A8T0TG79_PANVG|nr:hypothetical protein PVAP13_4NG292138 [Panicum virgatum]